MWYGVHVSESGIVDGLFIDKLSLASEFWSIHFGV